MTHGLKPGPGSDVWEPNVQSVCLGTQWLFPLMLLFGWVRADSSLARHITSCQKGGEEGGTLILPPSSPSAFSSKVLRLPWPSDLVGKIFIEIGSQKKRPLFFSLYQRVEIPPSPPGGRQLCCKLLPGGVRATLCCLSKRTWGTGTGRKPSLHSRLCTDWRSMTAVHQQGANKQQSAR